MEVRTQELNIILVILASWSHLGFEGFATFLGILCVFLYPTVQSPCCSDVAGCSWELLGVVYFTWVTSLETWDDFFTLLN